jgi:hypothetical protein
LKLESSESKDKNHFKTRKNKNKMPFDLLKEFLPDSKLLNIPKGSKFDEYEFCRLIYQKFRDDVIIDQSCLQSLFIIKRKKIVEINTFEQCIDLIFKSSNIIVLTGAGCSVS